MSEQGDLVREAGKRVERDLGKAKWIAMDSVQIWVLTAHELASMLIEERRKARGP